MGSAVTTTHIGEDLQARLNQALTQISEAYQTADKIKGQMQNLNQELTELKRQNDKNEVQLRLKDEELSMYYVAIAKQQQRVDNRDWVISQHLDELNHTEQLNTQLASNLDHTEQLLHMVQRENDIFQAHNKYLMGLQARNDVLEMQNQHLTNYVRSSVQAPYYAPGQVPITNNFELADVSIARPSVEIGSSSQHVSQTTYRHHLAEGAKDIGPRKENYQPNLPTNISMANQTNQLVPGSSQALGNHERTPTSDHRKLKDNDKVNCLNKLKQFSQHFQLSTPVPNDIEHLLSRDTPKDIRDQHQPVSQVTIKDDSAGELNSFNMRKLKANRPIVKNTEASNESFQRILRSNPQILQNGTDKSTAGLASDNAGSHTSYSYQMSATITNKGKSTLNPESPPFTPSKSQTAANDPGYTTHMPVIIDMQLASEFKNEPVVSHPQVKPESAIPPHLRLNLAKINTQGPPQGKDDSTVALHLPNTPTASQAQSSLQAKTEPAVLPHLRKNPVTAEAPPKKQEVGLPIGPVILENSDEATKLWLDLQEKTQTFLSPPSQQSSPSPLSNDKLIDFDLGDGESKDVPLPPGFIPVEATESPPKNQAEESQSKSLAMKFQPVVEIDTPANVKEEKPHENSSPIIHPMELVEDSAKVKEEKEVAADFLAAYDAKLKDIEGKWGKDMQVKQEPGADGGFFDPDYVAPAPTGTRILGALLDEKCKGYVLKPQNKAMMDDVEVVWKPVLKGDKTIWVL